MILDTVFVLVYIACLALRTWRINTYGPAGLLFMLFFDIFFVLPVFLDLFVGGISYAAYDVIIQAFKSDAVRLAYNCIVVSFGFGFTFAFRQHNTRPLGPMLIHRWGARFLLLVAYLPLAYVLFTGKLGEYTRYGGTLVNAALADGEFHKAVTSFVAISLVACGILIVASRRHSRDHFVQILLLTPAAIADIWLLSKRSPFAFLLLFIGMRFLVRARHKVRFKHALLAAALVSLLMGISVVYQSALRPDTLVDTKAAYEDFRIDMGRDHELRLALLPELVAGVQPILEHRMQSLLFIATLPVPRSLWPNKPYPYPVYVTSAALGIPVTELGWGLTTSLISECVANMGLGGLIPCFCFFVWAIRRLDRTRDPFIFLLGTLSACSLLVLNFSAVSVWHFSFIGYLSIVKILEFTRKPKRKRS